MTARASRWIALCTGAALTMAMSLPAAAEELVQENMVSTAGTVEFNFDTQALANYGLALSRGEACTRVPIGFDSSLEVVVVNDELHGVGDGLLHVSPGMAFQAGDTRIGFADLSIVPADQPDVGYEFTIIDRRTGQHVFHVAAPSFSYDATNVVFAAQGGWLRIAGDLAERMGNHDLASSIVGRINFQTSLFVISQIVRDSQDAEGQASGEPYGPRLPGPDVAYSDVGSISNYGIVGGIRAYALGSTTCNIGNQNLLWTNNGTPALAMNAFRLYDGRLEQIGMSWCKTACCAAAGNGCGLSCNGQGGSRLGAGCRDVYSSGWNGSQSRLQARSRINAFSGAMQSIPPFSGDPTISRRLQVHASDLMPANFPGALYFVEGAYASTDDMAAGNSLNNASYKRVLVSGTQLDLTQTGAIAPYQPAIAAWRANGLGAGQVDTRVVDGIIDVTSEGRFHYAYKVTNLGNGNWRYDYAVYNLNSDRSGGSVSIPVPAGVNVTNVGFHDVDYHSGEPYDNADWTSSVAGGAITWSSPQTYDENQNSNALRWGTMYNFWFEANTGPVAGNGTLGLFKPHTPQSVDFAASVPAAPAVAGDVNGDGHVDLTDLALLLSNFGCTSECTADLDNDGDTDLEDLAVVLANYGL